LKVLYDYKSNILLKMEVFCYDIMKNINVDRYFLDFLLCTSWKDQGEEKLIVASSGTFVYLVYNSYHLK